MMFFEYNIVRKDGIMYDDKIVWEFSIGVVKTVPERFKDSRKKTA